MTLFVYSTKTLSLSFIWTLTLFEMSVTATSSTNIHWKARMKEQGHLDTEMGGIMSPALTPVPVDVTLFGNRVLVVVIE